MASLRSTVGELLPTVRRSTVSFFSFLKFFLLFFDKKIEEKIQRKILKSESQTKNSKKNFGEAENLEREKKLKEKVLQNQLKKI